MEFYKKPDKQAELDDRSSEEIRVTDRRRRYLDQDGTAEQDATTEKPNLRPSYVEDLELRTKAAEKLAQEVQSRFQELRSQLQKETDETRLRLNRAADERAQREKADFIAALLPVLDNLQRAMEAADSGSSSELIGEGVRRTAESFENALSSAGVDPIKSVGELFDPELHEAVDTADVEPELEGKVISEYSRGYLLGERLLRPARVKVGRASERASSAKD
jgi:molecular chaperone GrpE